MEKEIIERAIDSGPKHIVYRDGDNGCRFENGHVIMVLEKTTVVKPLNGGELSIVNESILRIEEYRPKGWREKQ